jgi:transcriptional regulator with XRE-family HTH domain
MAEVADKAGYKQNYVAQVENGNFNPSKEFLSKSAELYGLIGTEKVKFFANALSRSRRIEIELDDIARNRI